MAVVSVAFDGTRVDAADAVGNWDLLDSSTKAGANDDIYYQKGGGASFGSISRKIGSTKIDGMEYEAGATVDFETTPKVFLAKTIITTVALTETKGANGGNLRIGEDQDNYYLYYIAGSDAYPASQGWIFTPIDPNVAGYRDSTVGTIDLTVVAYYAWQALMTAIARDDNIAMDAIDYFDSGTGLTLTAGDGGSTDGAFQDFIDIDEGTIANRWGVVTSKEEVLYVNGVLTIGSATATEFTDSLKTIVFPDGRVNAGFFGINIGLQNASTIIDISKCSFFSRGNLTTADTRAIFEIISTSGSATLDSNNIVNFASIVLTSAVIFSNNSVVNVDNVTQAGSTISGCSFSGTNVISENPELVTNSSFEQGITGHAMTCTTPGTYSWNNTDSGYTGTRGSNLVPNSGSVDAMFYNNSGGVITLNVTGAGQSPSVRNGVGATTTVQTAIDLIITVQDEDTNPIENAQVAIYKTSDRTQLMNEDTIADGTATQSYAGGATGIEIRIRKSSTGTTKYIPISTLGQTGATDYTLLVTLKEDPNAN